MRPRDVLVLAAAAMFAAPTPAGAQWPGLPDVPDEDDCVAGDSTPLPHPSPTAPGEPPTRRGRRHEFTLGTGFAITPLVLRRATHPAANYRIVLSLREATFAGTWSVFGQRAVGLRVTAGVAAGKPVLRFARPALGTGTDWLPEPDPIRPAGASVSVDASVGLVARTGPVRFGPVLAFTHAWLRAAGGYTVDVDIPYTTAPRLRATGFGFLVQAQPDPRVALSLEARAYRQQRHSGASLRMVLAASWSGG